MEYGIQESLFIGMVGGYLATSMEGGLSLWEMTFVAFIITIVPGFIWLKRRLQERFDDRFGPDRVSYDSPPNRAS